MTLIHTLGLLAVLVLLSLALSGLLSKAPDLRVLRDPKVVELNAHSAFMVVSGACGHGRKGRFTRYDCDCRAWREE